MKILFYIHGITGGGGERVLVTLANEFAVRGENVSIATDIHTAFAYDINNNIKLYDLYDGNKVANNVVAKLCNSI